MKRLTSLLAVITLLSVSSVQADPTGIWRSAPSDRGENKGGYIHVDIQACPDNSDALCGIIVKAFDKDDREGESDFTGKYILKNLKPSGNGKWTKGTIWAPDEDKTYKSKVTELSDGTLKVYGCLLGGMLCRGQVWQRVEASK